MATIDDVAALRLMCKGAYDLQKLRMQCGLRLWANFNAKLKQQANPAAEDTETDADEMSEEAEKLIAQLKASYVRLTDGIARNRTLPAQKGFNGDELISTFTELTLVDQYIQLEKQEARHFRQMTPLLEEIPIYSTYLKQERGIGPAMASVLISYLDPAKADHISAFWRYAGLDVGPDGMGRSRREEHLVERTYIDKNGQQKTRMGVTYNPFLKTKLAGVLASSFLRQKSRWSDVYSNYKHRITTDPNRTKVTVTEWKRMHKAGGMDAVRGVWTPGRIHNASSRYMLKMFLAELWTKWRTLEGLPLTPTYHEAVMGHVHTPSAQEQRRSAEGDGATTHT